MKASRATIPSMPNRQQQGQATPTSTTRRVSQYTDESDFDERAENNSGRGGKNDEDGNNSKDEIESVKRQRESDSSSESRDSSGPPSTSITPSRVSSTTSRGGWSDAANSHDSPATNSPSNSIPFVLDSSRDSHSRSYQLCIAQHPVTGAACGSLSRIPLAPPLFIQLIIRDRAGNIIPADDDLPFLVAIISLHEAESYNSEDLSFNHELYGTTVACPANLQDMQGNHGVYFIFPDVGIRRCGRWRLHVSLMRIALLGAQSILVKGDVGQRIAGIWTDFLDIAPQQVYVAPRITALTKHFIRQGVQMFLSSSVVPG